MQERPSKAMPREVIPALTFVTQTLKMLLLRKSSEDLPFVVYCFSLQLHSHFYWSHVENMAASNWMKFKVTSHWLTQFLSY